MAADPTDKATWSDGTTSTPWARRTPAEPAPPPMVAVAWLGRTSTEDAQDPTLSLPRQLRNSRAALPPGWTIVAHFYDVESGRKDLDARGRNVAHEQFQVPIPRDGGIADLMEEARRPDRRFTAVICESIERVARRTYFGTKVEYELEQNGVRLCAADEPILTERRAKRATPILTRRVKQAVSEWYVTQMLELAWDGCIEHTEQGWNIGKPPYGYLADKVPHPVPAKREQGATKHRLVPDPVRCHVVGEIFRLRVLEQLPYRRIADRLNADPQSYPPPLPNRADTASGRWTAAGVRSILENPKYTGYQVWNRKARKTKGNKANPVSEWVWSSRPTHEPLITRALFDAVWSGPVAHPGVRAKQGPLPARSADRSYLLRGYLFCALCGHRMYGKHSKGRSYYACQPKRDHHEDAEWYAEHPKAVWISARVMTEAVHSFFEQRIFGPDRQAMLQQQLAATAAAAPPKGLAEQLQAEVERLERAKGRLLDQLVTEDDTDGDPATAAEFRRGIRRRYDALEAQRRTAAARLEEVQPTAGPGVTAAAPKLLEALPELPIRFGELPEALQRLIYDAFQLRVRYDNRNRGVELQVTIRAVVADELAALAQRAADAAQGGDSQPFGVRPRQDSNLRPSA